MQIDYPELYGRADWLKDDFRAASPFPHARIKDFLAPDAYRELQAAFPGPEDPIWKTPENAHTKAKMVTRRGPDDLKELLYPPQARAVLREFNSGPFLRFLSKLTGILGLVPDPYFAEAGFHCTGNGGFLDIHADFSHHDELGLERRLNLILFLNDDWKVSYGGALGLYDIDLVPRRTILPHGNTAVVFTTSETSYHGHPEPMKLPSGVYRRSLALYYYALPTERRRRHSVIFPADPDFMHKVSVET